MSLLEETLGVMRRHGVKPEDVRWVGSKEFGHTSWDNFAEVAKDAKYDSGYGSAEVAQDLLIVGDDWWMSRGEYDGSEWWDFHRKPEPPEQQRAITVLVGDYWPTLTELHVK